jgi:hypothetical protein
MSYASTRSAFTARELATFRAHARRALRTRELRAR